MGEAVLSIMATTILAADTSTSINTVALCRGEGDSSTQDAPNITLLAETVVESNRLHAERMITTVQWVLEEARLTMDDIDLLAVSHGPGSFTGVRIGVATWKGLALGKNIPLVAVPTLDAMTWLHGGDHGLICPLLDARMKEVYSALYRSSAKQQKKLIPDQVGSMGNLLRQIKEQMTDAHEPVSFLGDGASLYRAQIMESMPEAHFVPAIASLPRASAVAAEGYTRMRAGASTDAALVAPLYLRKSQAEVNREKKADHR
jgi:tRNA threonylcarbamoyladenosine biosynthesis protein TsaB